VARDVYRPPAMRMLLLATTLALAATTSSAHADSRVGATIGLFTPTGDVGLEVAQAVHENAELSLGIGYGLLVRVGPQVAAMPRLRYRSGAVTFSAGAGLSLGKYNNISPFARISAPKITTLWGNVEAALQVTSQRGPFIRGFLGAGSQLAHGSYDTSDPELQMETDDVIPYGGINVGTSF
jgi:hypothetical protein